MDAREILVDIALHGVRACDPLVLVKDNVWVDSSGCIVVCGERFCPKGSVYIVGFGKASARMALALEEILGDRIAGGVVVTKYGYSEKLRYIDVLEAGHPVPDRNSLEAGRAVVEFLESTKEDDLVFVLVSGGGSSLLVYPVDSVSFEDKMATHKMLVESGASIHEINTVRKHLSRVKGGWLTTYTKATMVSLIISDVVGNDLSVIASGPTVADPSSFYDAYKVLVKYGLWSRVPESVREYIEKGLRGEALETPKSIRGNVYNYIIGDTRVAVEAMYKRALEFGWRPYILTTMLQGEAIEVAKTIGSMIREIHYYNRPFRKPCILIAGGELTVRLPEKHGVGGPNQEFVLALAREIRGLRETVVLAIDSDGTDGPTDAAGGIVDHNTYDRLLEKGIDIDHVLTIHDSYNTLKTIDSLVHTGPTKTNVNSLYTILLE